jgi:DNA-binding response OmpR family regulator
MKQSGGVLLAINDTIIALDIEDLIQSHFDCSVTTLTLLDAENQIDKLNPELIIVDCDINYLNVCTLLSKIDNKRVRKICFCTSERQAKELDDHLTDVLFKPFDNDDLIAAVSNIFPSKADLQQTK